MMYLLLDILKARWFILFCDNPSLSWQRSSISYIYSLILVSVIKLLIIIMFKSSYVEFVVTAGNIIPFGKIFLKCTFRLFIHWIKFPFLRARTCAQCITDAVLTKSFLPIKINLVYFGERFYEIFTSVLLELLDFFIKLTCHFTGGRKNGTFKFLLYG